MAFEFVASGAGEEHTIRWNREAYDRIALRPRFPESAPQLDMSVSLFDRVMPFPILLAPTAYHNVLHPEGEVATAKGASAAGATWVVSSASTTPIEDIVAVSTAPLWFQLYIQSDRQFTKDLVQRVAKAGCAALCLTVDTPVLGARDRQARAGFKLPAGMTTPHLDDIGPGKREIMNPRREVVTWKEVEWLRSLTHLPLLLKGILTADAAERGVQAGADGLIVSNHGGRNLDTLPASLDALAEVAERIAGRVPLLVDGGIRRGTDVLKAIAVGARAVLIGRPYCYGLALGGAAGVQRVIEILRTELEMAMLLSGRPALGDIDQSVLWNARKKGDETGAPL
jgi:4-hydroxymandelate oxidase